MDEVPIIEELPSKAPSHARSPSEPPASALLIKKGFSRVEANTQLELQGKNQDALSLSTDETAIMMDNEGNLRDELGFLFGAATASPGSSRKNSQKSSEFDEGAVESALSSVSKSANQKPSQIRISGFQYMSSSRGLLLAKNFTEVQRRAWDDFQQQVGGTIQALTTHELQRWKKSRFDALIIGAESVSLSHTDLSDRTEQTTSSRGDESPRNTQGVISRPIDALPPTKRKRLLFRFFSLRSTASRKNDENIRPTTPLARISKTASFKFRQPTKIRGKQLTQLIRTYGIPTELREQVWIACCGANEKQRQATADEQYIAVLEKARASSPASATQIELDLHRTFPTNYVYQQDEGIASLRHVLLAYSQRNPVVGYCQSMNFIVATLLLHMGENEAFWVLSAIVEDLLPGYFTPELVGVHVDQRTFVALVAARFPRVTAHLERLQLPLAVVVYQWFMCLFVNALPLGTTLRVWDAFLHEGPKVLFRVGLTIIKVIQKDLLQTTTFQEAYEVLSESTKDRNKFSAHRLLRMAFDPLNFGSFSSKMLSEMRQRQLIVVRRELGLDENNRPILGISAGADANAASSAPDDSGMSTPGKSDMAKIAGHTDHDETTLSGASKTIGTEGLSSGEANRLRGKRTLTTLRRDWATAELTADTFTWGFSPRPLRLFESEEISRPSVAFAELGGGRRRANTSREEDQQQSLPKASAFAPTGSEPRKRTRAQSLDSPLKRNGKALAAEINVSESPHSLRETAGDEDKQDEKGTGALVESEPEREKQPSAGEDMSDEDTIWESDEDLDGYVDDDDDSLMRNEKVPPVRELGPTVNLPSVAEPMTHTAEDGTLTDVETLGEGASNDRASTGAESVEDIPTVDLPAEFSTRLRSLSFVLSARQTGSAVMATATLQQHTLAQVPEEEMLDLHDILGRFDELSRTNEGSTKPLAQLHTDEPEPIRTMISSKPKRRSSLLAALTCGGCGLLSS